MFYYSLFSYCNIKLFDNYMLSFHFTGCMVMENIFIKAGETAQLPDCVQLQCLDKGDHILAITSM